MSQNLEPKGQSLKPVEGYSSTKRSSDYTQISRQGKGKPGSNKCQQVTGLSVTSTTTNSIGIAWTGLSGVDHYNIYRSLDNFAYSQIATSPIASYTDGNLSPNTTYYYRVSAVLLNTLQLCTQSATVSSTTLRVISSGDRVIWLDFDGATVNGTSWQFVNQSFGPTALTVDQINAVIAAVTTEFAKVDSRIVVTTSESVFLAGDINKRQHVIITDDFEWYCGSTTPCASGVSYVGSFNYGNDTPNFVFPSCLYYRTDYTVIVIMHECGHTFGLHHTVVTCGGILTGCVNGFGDFMGSPFGCSGYFGQPSLDTTCTYVYEQDVIRSKL